MARQVESNEASKRLIRLRFSIGLRVVICVGGNHEEIICQKLYF